jgi:crotonobetainyl-CoA:carnitine CoA-transferase CaiB-like acyl-CoA transferase
MNVPSANRPLDGIKVLDASRVLAGPYCAYLLALLGASVTRVERPPNGDSIRWRSRVNPQLGNIGLSTDYIAQAANKNLVYLNLAEPEDRQAFLRLVGGADVLVENFRTGSLNRLGLTENVIEEANPSLIWCSITGYGRTGPRAEFPAYDSVIQAASGMMKLTGNEASGPMKTGASVIDYTTGLNAALGVVSSVLMRKNAPGASGARVGVSMLDTALAMMQSTVSGYLNGDESLAPRGNAASSGNQLSRAYETLDGAVCVAVNEPHQLTALWGALGITGDQRSDDVALLDEVAQRIRARRTLDLDRSLNKAGVPCAPVQGLDAALQSSTLADPAFVQKAGDHRALRFVSLPFSINGDRGEVRTAPAAHNKEG